MSLALSLVLLSLSVLLLGDLFGLRGSIREPVAASRKLVAETLAMNLSTLAGLGDEPGIQGALQHLVGTHTDVLAASLVRTDGTVLGQHGEVALLDAGSGGSPLERLRVPIFSRQAAWGNVQIVFAPAVSRWQDAFWLSAMALGMFISFVLFLVRVLVQLDPGRAVPGRVDSALNLFSAGVIVLDAQLRVVLVNRAAETIAGQHAPSLTGRLLDEWPWQAEAGWQAPWATTLHSGLAVSDQPLRLRGPDGQSHLYLVSCSFVGDDSARLQGVMVTLDDLTQVERKNQELARTLSALRRSQQELTEKTHELQRLATTDPLTGIANRRTLMEQLAADLKRTRANGEPLACVMTDIDHFKRINDTHGHAMGDAVIKAVAETLDQHCREGDTVGRYGGEEFVLILPGRDARQAVQIAEKVRVAIMALGLGEQLALDALSASFGVADTHSKAIEGADLVDHADRGLYRAKESGRNRVCIHAPHAPGTDSTPSDPTGPIEIVPSSEDLAQVQVVELQSRLAERDRDVARLQEFDSLTGMPMRTLFVTRVATEMTRSRRHGTLVGVMSLEIQQLERIVATLGHDTADALVVAFAERVQTGLRASDAVLTIIAGHSLSRVTANEYGVLLSELADASGALVVITRLRRLLGEPFLIEGQHVYVGANIGIALSDTEDGDAARLLSQASEARMEAAKKLEKVAHSFASASLDAASKDYIRLEADLHDALQAGSLETWFQPMFDLATRRVTGMEALLRWRHETRGFVPPDVFVALAEANGMIGQLYSLVLEQTLVQIQEWNAMGFDDLRVSINISPMQLRSASLVPDTVAALARVGVSGEQLEIELTDTSVLNRPTEAREALEALRRFGITISMDDFGTGYTSLALLAQLPLDTVKIDRSFIVAMAEGERDRAVIESIIKMARALNLRVVGEGVETNEELEALARYGCNEIQGYLISRPCPGAQISRFLVQQRDAQRRRTA